METQLRKVWIRSAMCEELAVPCGFFKGVQRLESNKDLFYRALEDVFKLHIHSVGILDLTCHHSMTLRVIFLFD